MEQRISADFRLYGTTVSKLKFYKFIYNRRIINQMSWEEMLRGEIFVAWSKENYYIK